MASIAQLREIAGRYAANQSEAETMMQHKPRAIQENNDSYERRSSVRPRSVGSARKNTGRNDHVSAVNKSLGEAAEKQTEILQSQADATKKQGEAVNRQSGLMRDQIKATQEVSDVVKRLAAQMERQSKKITPKIQEFARPDATGKQFHGNRNAANDAVNRRRSISEELRERRRERARRQERDERGRFRRNRITPRIQTLGGGAPGSAGAPGGALARLGGMAMRGAGPLAVLAAMFFGSKALDAARDNYEYDKNKAGTIAKGWQSAKDWAGDSMGAADREETMISLKNKMSDNQISATANRASNGPLGSVAEHFESGGRGVGTVSTGKGDNGGVSYGKHQLSSKSGSMTSFLRSEEGSKFYNDFRGLAPGSKEFDEKYKQVAKDRGAEMETAQSSFIKRTHYDPVSGWFSKQFGIDPEKRSKAFREMLYSIGVQYGFAGARSLISEALGNRDVSSMSDRELINRIQNFRQSSVSDKFRSSSRDTQLDIADRAGNEKKVYLDMLDRETTGKNNTNMGGRGESVLTSQIGKPNVGGSQIQTAADSFKPQGGASATSDEAGGGTMAGKDFQANGNFYNIGLKNTVPRDNTVNMAGLNDKFKQAFYTMVGDWVTNYKGTKVLVASAFRTRAEQEQLWVKYGRNTKRVARPGTSRHESGFAIDIDRASAQSMESSGLFKKYGFHRPLSNEPWHVEMIGAGKGGAKGGGGAATEQPATMQAAAAKEMIKAADATIATAEENTKAEVTAKGPESGVMSSDSETSPSPTAEAGAQKAQADATAGAEAIKTGGGGGGPGGPGGVTTTPQQNLQGIMELKDKNRNPAEQALYEQYLKGVGGDPRKVPDIVTNGFAKQAENVGPKPANAGDPYRVQTTSPGTGIPVQAFEIKQGDLKGSALDTMGTPGSALDSMGKPGDALNDLTKAAADPNKKRRDSDVLNEISIDENGRLTHIDPTGVNKPGIMQAPGLSTPGFNPTAQNSTQPGTGNGITKVPNGMGGVGVGISGNPQATAGTMDAFGRLFDVRLPNGGYGPYGSSSNGGGNADIAKGVRMARSLDPKATGTVTGGVDKMLGLAGAGYRVAHADNKADAILRSGALPGFAKDMGMLQSAKGQFDYNPIAAAQTLMKTNTAQGIMGGISGLFGPKKEDAPTNSPTMTRAPATSGNIQSTAELFKPSISPNSPASPAFYSSDTPVISRPSAPAQTMAPATPVSSFTAAPPVERQVFDNVQTVRVADATPTAAAAGGPGAAPSGGQSSGNGNSQMDPVQLDEIPAMLDDFGLVFINSGFV